MSDKTLAELLNNKRLNHSSSSKNLEKAKEILKTDFCLYHIQELTFEDESPRKEGFENVLSSLRIDGVVFVYLLLGDEDGVSFYLGIVKDKKFQNELELDVDDIGNDILSPSIEGNFRGSKIEKVDFRTNSIKESIGNFKRFAKIDGVPSVNAENEEFQGVDRLVDVMNGDEFAMMILADPLSPSQIQNIENKLYQIYDKINPLSKKSIQSNRGESQTQGSSAGESSSKTSGTNDGASVTITDGTSNGTNKGTSNGSSSGGSSSSTNKGGSEGSNEGKNHSTADGTSKGTSASTTTGENVGTNSSTQSSTGESKTLEFSDKNLQSWLEYIDETLLSMVRNGKNKGLYYTNIYLLANSKGTLLKLGNTLRSLFSGKEDNKAPLRFEYITDENEIEHIKNFQLPKYRDIDSAQNEKLYNLLHSRSDTLISANWLSTNELSVVAGLPQKEVLGLILKEEVEFGLNIKADIKDEDRLLLGIFKQKIQYEGEELCFVLNSDRDDFEIDESIVVAQKQYFSGVDMQVLIFDRVEKELGIFFAPEIEYSFDFKSKTSSQEEEIIENRSTHTDGVLQDYYKKKTLEMKR